MAVEDEFSNEDLKKYEIFNPEHTDIVELQHDGRILMHCDKHRIWYLHVGDKLVPLDELMGNLALIKRVMNELADNARSSDSPPPVYDPEFGDDRVCMCGHPYYRHFDSYDAMAPIGCKYCQCFGFSEKATQ